MDWLACWAPLIYQYVFKECIASYWSVGHPWCVGWPHQSRKIHGRLSSWLKRVLYILVQLASSLRRASTWLHYLVALAARFPSPSLELFPTNTCVTLIQLLCVSLSLPPSFLSLSFSSSFLLAVLWKASYWMVLAEDSLILGALCIAS